VVLTDPDSARDVIPNFNTDVSDTLYPRYSGGEKR